MIIKVQPNVLYQSAAKIEESTMQYQKHYQHLYQCVEKMQVSWKGKDNIAYTVEIKNFEKDFLKMVNLMRQYADFLRKSADMYTRTQEERVAKVKTILK